MHHVACNGCSERDARIADLERQVAQLRRHQHSSTFLRDEAKNDRDLRLLTGESASMKRVRADISQVAKTDSTVLILGETGTGKELVARAIHQLSPRRENMFVPVHCAALAPSVVASELFGHEQGAFTGAVKTRIGRFELADHGTIFLDEVGELPLEMQVILLRVLQERVIERVGASRSLPVDVRIVAATHRDLNSAVAEGAFRADLFFRLNVFPIVVPPLRERPGDIPDLVRHFLLHFGRKLGRAFDGVSDASMQALLEYHWPGNVRELENIVERAMIVGSGATLEIDSQWLAPVSLTNAVPSSHLAEVERQTIRMALERCRGRVYGPNGAASMLGIKPTTLYSKMRKLKIAKHDEK